MPRLFVGTKLDSENQKAIEKLIDCLQSDSPEHKWTPGENLHMTWSFIGEVQEDSISKISNLLEQEIAQFPKLKLPERMEFDQFEFWPNDEKPKLLVLTASQTPDSVKIAASLIDETIRPFKDKVEHFPFKAHITLARLKTGETVGNVRKNMEKSFKTASMQLTDIVLLESCPNGRQNAYRAVSQFKI